MNNPENYLEDNRKLWNERTKAHLVSDFYGNEAFKAGKNTLKPPELEILGDDLTGKSVLHLQCHFGQDSLSMARMGATVTGIDFSDKAIAAAKGLSEELNIPARFLCGNVYDTTQLIGDEQFDFVFSTYGTICWIPDLDPWAELVARHLKPGGSLILAEFHPTYYMFNFDNMELEYSYFNVAPIVEEPEGSYANPEAKLAAKKEISWNHNIGEIMTALIKQGLQIADFTEYPYCFYDCFPGLENQGEGKYMVKGKEGILPLMYRMVVKKA